MPNKFYYYKATGRANQIRLTLAAAGVPWEDIYASGFPPTKEETQTWRDVGKNSTTNIPMLEMEDGRVLTQSLALVRAVARMGDGSLTPTDAKELYLFDKIISDADDLRTLSYSSFPSWGCPQSSVNKYIQETLPLHLGNFERQLTGDYFVGSSLTAADICAYDAIVSFGSSRIDGALDNFPKLQAFAARVEAHPAIAEYMASPEYEALMKMEAISVKEE